MFFDDGVASSKDGRDSLPSASPASSSPGGLLARYDTCTASFRQFLVVCTALINSMRARMPAQETITGMKGLSLSSLAGTHFPSASRVRGAQKLFLACLIILLILWCYIASIVMSSSSTKNRDGTESLQSAFLPVANASLKESSDEMQHLRGASSNFDTYYDLKEFTLATKESEDLLLPVHESPGRSREQQQQQQQSARGPEASSTNLPDLIEAMSRTFTAAPSPASYSGIDIVFTFVNDADEVWLRTLKDAVGEEDPTSERAFGIDTDRATTGEDTLMQRRESRFEARRNKYREWGELRYSMRSFLVHAGHWLRHFIVVTANAAQIPPWLNISHPRIRIVHHAALFDDPASQLPTFNSLAIESVLHHIPRLSEHFLYVNNDLFLSKRTDLDAFWDGERGVYYSYTDWEIVFPTSCRDYIDEVGAPHPRSLKSTPPCSRTRRTAARRPSCGMPSSLVGPGIAA